MKVQEIYELWAGALSWELQSSILSIRDDGVKAEDVPADIFVTLYTIGIINPERDEAGNVQLSYFGEELSKYCSC